MEYRIEVDICLGFSHCGGVTAEGEGVIDLSDKEVNALVELMKKKQTTDATELALEKSHPKLYKKLHDAYSEVACNAEKRHWIMRGFELGGEMYDLEVARKYCEENGLYKQIPEDDDYEFVDIYDFVKHQREIDRHNNFTLWLHDYLEELDDKSVYDFYYKYINDGVNLDDIEYDIIDIPEEIKKMMY